MCVGGVYTASLRPSRRPPPAPHQTLRPSRCTHLVDCRGQRHRRLKRPGRGAKVQGHLAAPRVPRALEQDGGLAGAPPLAERERKWDSHFTRDRRASGRRRRL